MANVRLEIILLGDGMSGKTSILIKIAEIVLEQAMEEYQAMLVRREIPSHEEWLFRVKPTLDERELEKIIERRPLLKHVPQAQYLAWLELAEPQIIGFEDWLKREGILLEDILTKDTSLATLGLETFEMRFPLGRHYLFVSGYDLGGQNVYDHLRNVLAGLAKPESYLLIVFDSSRYISCENSVRQLEDSIKKFEQRGKATPTIVSIMNKIDLHRYLDNAKRQESISHWVFEALVKAREEGYQYQFPHVIKKDEVIELSIEPTTKLGFEHLEAIIYDTLRRNIHDFGKPPLTELNARSVARELAARLLLLQQPEENFEQFYEELKKVIFEERPLAVQFMGGFKLKALRGEIPQDELLSHVRKKFERFVFDLERVTKDDVHMAIKKSIRTEQLERDLRLFSKRVFKTNALGGEGIVDLFVYLAYQETTKAEQKSIERADVRGKGSLKRL